MTSKAIQPKGTRTCPRCHGNGYLKKSHYKVGRSFEYEVIAALREKKWYTYRSYSSKGVFDIIAQRGNRLLAIQVKRLSQKNKSYLPPKDRDSLNDSLCINEYDITFYDMKTNKPRSIILKGEFEIVHAYNDNGIKWRKLMQRDIWETWYLD